MTRLAKLTAWSCGITATAVALDILGFLLAVELFDGDFDLPIRVIQLSVPTLITLIASFGIPLLGGGVMVAMADCHHRENPPPSLKEN